MLGAMGGADRGRWGVGVVRGVRRKGSERARMGGFLICERLRRPGGGMGVVFIWAT